MAGADGNGEVTSEGRNVETTDDDMNVQISTSDINNNNDSSNNKINVNSINNYNGTPTRSPITGIAAVVAVATASAVTVKEQVNEGTAAATKVAVHDAAQEAIIYDPNGSQATANKNSQSPPSSSPQSKRIAPASRISSTPKSSVSTDLNAAQGALPVLIAPRESNGNPPPHPTPPHPSRYQHHHHPYSPLPMHYYHYAGHPPPPHTPSYYTYPYSSHPPTAQHPHTQQQQPLPPSTLSPLYTGTAASSSLTKPSTATATSKTKEKEAHEESPSFPPNESMSAAATTAATVKSTPHRKPSKDTTSANSLTVASPSLIGGKAPSPNRATVGTTTPVSGHHHHHYYYPGSSTSTGMPPPPGGTHSPYSAWPPPHSGAYHHHPYPPVPHHPVMLPPPPHTTSATAPSSAATTSSYLHPPPHPSHLYQPPPLHASAPDTAWKGNVTTLSSPTVAPPTPPPTSGALQPAPHAPPHPSHAPSAYMWPPPHLAHPPHALHPYAYHVPPYARSVQAPPPPPSNNNSTTEQQPTVSISQGERYQRPTALSTTSLSPTKQQQQAKPPNGTADRNVALAPSEPSGTMSVSTATIVPPSNESSSHALVADKPPNDSHPIANRMRIPPRSKMDDTREGATSPSEIETHHRDEIQHMGCTCKKTRCLKLYCQCFGFKLYCGPNCRCLLCFNTKQHGKQRKLAINTILSRNPLAFDAKFKKDAPVPPLSVAVTGVTEVPVAPLESTDATLATSGAAAATSSEKGETTSNESTGTGAREAMSATAVDSIATETNRILAHRLGCKCRRSACMKKYCECYAGNVKCSTSCRCIGCKNMGSTADFRATRSTANDNSIRSSSTTSAAPMAMTAAAAAHHATATMYPYPPPPHHHHHHQYGYPYPHIAPHPHYPHMHQYPYMMPPPQHLAPPQAPPHGSSHHAPIQSGPLQSQPPQRDSGGNDSWIAAAQSLTFLKQSSPAGEHKRLDNFSMGVSPIAKSRGGDSKVPTLARKGAGNSRVPSLASSSDGNVLTDDLTSVFHNFPYESTPEFTRSKRGAAASASSHSGDGEDNTALLMAAVAMTEFGQSPPPSTSMLSPDNSMIRRSGSHDGNVRTPDIFAMRDDDDDDNDKSLSNSGNPSFSAKRTSTRTTRGKSATKRDLNFDEVMSTPRRKRKPKYLDD